MTKKTSTQTSKQADDICNRSMALEKDDRSFRKIERGILRLSFYVINYKLDMLCIRAVLGLLIFQMPFGS